MSAKPEMTPDTVAHDFKVSMQGKLDQAKIDAVVESLSTVTTKYPANGSVASAIFYIQATTAISSPGGKNFVGHGGGLFTPGGGALFGDVYTNDLDRLYRDTVSFECNATNVYLSLLFFDGNSNLLGHYQAGAISTVIGVGGGTGRWS